ncbi:hypothetical protein [Pseudooceanicola algae]|uniref:hypothetical protein n=1 Tax=Pseudooceanicola algae TaxID=1537215 RepID=UPI000E6C7D30|nr:hypothetical protein [Pseudooceanicola algae]
MQIIPTTEALVSEVEACAARLDVAPQKILRDGIGAGWGAWDAWKSGKSSPTLRVVDRLRAHMAIAMAEKTERDAA